MGTFPLGPRISPIPKESESWPDTMWTFELPRVKAERDFRPGGSGPRQQWPAMDYSRGISRLEVRLICL